jgi:hypothetical protein
MEALFWVFSFGGMPGAQVIAPTAVALLALMSQSQRTGADCQSSAVVAGQDLVELAHLWCGLFRKRPQPSLANCWAQQAEKVVTLGLRVHIAKLVEAQLLSMASISSSDRLVLMMMCKVLPSARLPRPLGHTFGKCS